MRLTTNEVAQALGSAVEPKGRDISPSGYSIDSRTLRAGDCFIAIRGRHFDGHQFIPEAVRKGASLLIVSHRESRDPVAGAPCIRVDDTLRALQQLASRVRRRWGKTLVAITGSAGKTSTKEIASHLLEGCFKVFKNLGNFNNDYGLPLSLLQLEPDHEIAVVELGMSAPGEIARLSKIAEPNMGVVTNVKPVHLEFFSSLGGIARAKRELIEQLSAEGVAFLNNDDAHVRKFGYVCKGEIVTFGIERPAAYRVCQIRLKGLAGCEFKVRHHGQSHALTSPLLGSHNVTNALPGIALAHRLGLGFEAIGLRLQSLEASPGRGRLLQFQGGFCVIDDSYNSNPTALLMMMRLLNRISGYRRKILVAGEMLEMGADSLRFHQACGKAAAGWGFDLILGIQGLADGIVASARALGYDAGRAAFFQEATEAGEWLAARVQAGDLILVKGSRGVKTERVIQTLRKDFALST